MLRKDENNQIIYPETAEDTAADEENEFKQKEKWAMIR